MKNVLISGGSSGIGLELSRHFAKNGYRLLWVSKPIAELEAAKKMLETEIPGVTIETLAKDLTKPEACQEVFNWVKKNNHTLDVLVNNAGFGTYGYCSEIPVNQELNMIELNVVSLYKMTRLFLPEMLEKNAGTIINISSTSSLQPVPRMNTYASTKAFVRHFTLGIQEELRIKNSKVKAITVIPAAINDTPFQQKAKMHKVKTFKGLATTTAKEVANDIWKGFSKDKTVIVSGWKMRALQRIRFLMPNWLQGYIVRKETEIAS